MATTSRVVMEQRKDTLETETSTSRTVVDLLSYRVKPSLGVSFSVRSVLNVLTLVNFKLISEFYINWIKYYSKAHFEAV